MSELDLHLRHPQATNALAYNVSGCKHENPTPDLTCVSQAVAIQNSATFLRVCQLLIPRFTLLQP